MRRTAMAATVLGILACAAPAGAATTFGLLDWSSPSSSFRGMWCTSGPCLLYSQGPVYASPGDGVIVRWRTDVLCAGGGVASGTLRMRVFRRAGDRLTLKGGSEPLERNQCSSVDVPTSVRISAGDEIGIQVDTPDFRITASRVQPASPFIVEPLPAEGVEADDGVAWSNPASEPQVRLLIQAVLEADFDKDGLGDETQDADDDGDGILDSDDATPLDPDSDDDGVKDGADDCRTMPGVAPRGCPPGDLPPVVTFRAPAAGAALPAAGAKLVATATDDRGIAAVEFIDDEVVLCRDTAAPYECQYTPDDTDVGQNLIVARATDSVGQQAVALRSLSIGRFTPRAVSHTSSRRGASITTSGTLTLPTGVGKKNGCAGRVSVQVKSGSRTVSRRVVKLTTNCTYRLRRTVRRRGRLSVIVRFEGNAVLAARKGPTRTLR